jgi:hypothetical protein
MNAISCNAGPAILAITPDLAASTGTTVVRIAAGYFALPAPSCGGAWCRLAPYRLACVFNFTFMVNTANGPQWRSQLWLSNTTRQVSFHDSIECTSMKGLHTFLHLSPFPALGILGLLCWQNSDGTWVPISPAHPLTDKYAGPRSQSEADDCRLPSSGSAAYRCLSCRAPAATPLLQHDLAAAGGNRSMVSVSLGFATEPFQVSTVYRSLPFSPSVPSLLIPSSLLHEYTVLILKSCHKSDYHTLLEICSIYRQAKVLTCCNQECKTPAGPGDISLSCNTAGVRFVLPSPATTAASTTEITSTMYITQPLIVGVSVGGPVPPLPLQYFGRPVVQRVSPRSAPVSVKMIFSVLTDINTTSSGGGNAVPLRKIFNETGAACRLDRCPATKCDTAGQGCSCASEIRLLGNEIGKLTMASDSHFLCAVSNTAVSMAGLYLVAISLNGQEFMDSPNSTVILFYEVPKIIDANTPNGLRLNFGVNTSDVIGVPPWGLAAAAPSIGGTPLILFVAEPDCVPGTGSVACVMRFSASGSCPLEAGGGPCQGRSASPALRFVPGQCSPADICSCESSPSTRDAPLIYSGIQHSNRSDAPLRYSILRGKVPESGPEGQIGLHYVCFSVDGMAYLPILPQVT